MPDDLFGFGFEHAFLEWMDHAELADLCEGVPAIRSCVRGVAFGANRELRWQRRWGGLFHAVLVDDTGARLPEADESVQLQELPKETPKKILLWGVFQDSAFREGRIPGLLPYPKALGIPDMRLAVKISHYRFQEEPDRRLFRCVAVVSTEVPE